MTERKRTRNNPSTRSAKPRASASNDTRLEDRTRMDLFELARQLGVGGYAEMSKQELVEAIRRR